MFIIDENVFTGEVSIPQLAVSRVLGSLPTYGSAKAIQTSGENNLDVFVDEKTTEYLRLMFGESLCEALAQAWFEYVSNDSKVSTLIHEVDDTFTRNEWVDVVHTGFDIKFSEAVLEQAEVIAINVVLRFGKTKITDWKIGDVTLKLRVRDDGSLSIFVTEGVITGTLTLKNEFNPQRPSEPFRKLINVLLPYKGAQPVSPIANYVWFHLTRDASNGTTAMGEADLNFSRSTSASETDKYLKSIGTRNKLIRAWNGMAEMNVNVVAFLRSNSTLFVDYAISYREHRNMLRTINTFNL
jgi:hypothetical protein